MEKAESEKGEKLGSGNIYFQIVKIAVPATLAMLVVAFYAICDTYFLGVLGFLSCGGVCYPVLAVCQGVAMTFAFGSANNISKCIGGGERGGAREYFFSGLAFSVLIAVLVGGIVGIFSSEIVAFCGGGDNAWEVSQYLKVQGFTFVVFSVYFYLSAVLRSEGRAGVVMFASVCALCCNFILDYVSVTYLDFGVVGIAVATCFSQVLAIAILLFAVSRSDIASFDFVYFSFYKVFQIITLGSSSFFRQLMGGFSALALNFVCLKIGGEFLAGATLASKVSVLLFSFALGLGQGMQPVMAYYFGAGDKSESRKAFVFTLILAVCVGVAIGFLQFVFADEITSLFAVENHLAGDIALKILRVSAFSVVFSFSLVIINMAFQAVEKKFVNVAISILRQGVVFIPTLFLLCHFFGSEGVVWSHFVADSIAFVLSAVLCAKFLRFEKG